MTEYKADPTARALSARETEIARLVCAGYSNRAVADKLVIAVKTVDVHMYHIKQKLGLRGREGYISRVLLVLELLRLREIELEERGRTR